VAADAIGLDAVRIGVLLEDVENCHGHLSLVMRRCRG
jgi:hypothetical protein